MFADQLHQQPIGRLKVIILEDSRYEVLGMVTELDEAKDIEVIQTSADPDEVVTLAESYLPDVIFVDLRIRGDLNAGITVIQKIKTVSAKTKCIVLTAFPELPNFLAAFDAGAEAFIKKEAIGPQPSLAELVRLIAAGGRYYDSEVVEQMRLYLDEARIPPASSGSTELPPSPLTKREQEVLLELAKKKSYSEIAAKLFITENTVRAHISNIISKLNAEDRHEAVLIAISRGWLTNNPTSVE